MSQIEFSVLMSVYYKEKKEYFKESIESILAQTLKPTEIVLVEDGPLTKELYELIDYFVLNNPCLFKIVKLEENMGLGLALREGILNCNYSIIARMDTDDIALSTRFEKQIKYLIDNDLDICGSHIKEFETTQDKIIAVRKVPLTHANIVNYQKKRSAFNHMTVMFKKEAVLKAGNYKHCPLMEDDLLWVEMIQSGANCGNIDDYLVYARTNSSMIGRRGGFRYYKKYSNARKKIYKTGFISWFTYKKTCIIQFIVCIMPSFLRRFVFFKLLHKKSK